MGEILFSGADADPANPHGGGLLEGIGEGCQNGGTGGGNHFAVHVADGEGRLGGGQEI